ncbi:NAD-dependent epimerase/dehydratase family protein, partial [Candidatus Bathyarchaeota archaeon]
MTGRIVLAGGTGFIGTFLRQRLAADGYEVVLLTRSPIRNGGEIRQVPWDGQNLGDWRIELEGSHALINLSGRSVNCRYNEKNRREILESRVETTRILGEAVARAVSPPPV